MSGPTDLDAAVRDGIRDFEERTFCSPRVAVISESTWRGYKLLTAPFLIAASVEGVEQFHGLPVITTKREGVVEVY